jgi:hypothetical protein
VSRSTICSAVRGGERSHASIGSGAAASFFRNINSHLIRLPVNSVCLRTRYEQKLNVDFPTGRRASLEKAFFPGAAPFVQASAAESGRVRDWSVSDLAMHFYSREFDPLNPSGCSGPSCLIGRNVRSPDSGLASCAAAPSRIATGSAAAGNVDGAGTCLLPWRWRHGEQAILGWS